jgi:hypothetical protein
MSSKDHSKLDELNIIILDQDLDKIPGRRIKSQRLTFPSTIKEIFSFLAIWKYGNQQ